MMNRLLIALIIGLFSAQLCSAQTDSRNNLYRDSVYRRVIKDGTSKLSCYLSYPQGNHQVMPNYGTNATELDKLNNFIRSAFADKNIYVRQIKLMGYCSIEGSLAANEQLAKNRVNGFLSYLNTRYNLSQRYPVELDWVAEDWDKLRELVAASQLPERDEVLQIIDKVPILKGREKLLMELNGGIPYRTMLAELFPGLRRVEITVIYDLHRIIEERYQRKMTDAEFQQVLAEERAKAAAEEERLANLARDEARALAQAQAQAESEARKKAAIDKARKEEEARIAEEARLAAEKDRLEAERERQALQDARLAELRKQRDAKRALYNERMKLSPIVGIKTNAISWAGITPEFEYKTFMPNLTAEVFFLDQWSAQASGTYAYWDYDSGKQFWGVSGYSVEPRFWPFSSDGLYRWLYIGVFGQFGDFDVRSIEGESKGGATTNYTGTYWQGGLSLGCYIPLLRHFGLEIGARGGYQSSNVKVYDIEPPYNYFNHKETKNRIGLMELNVSLSYRFGL